MQTDEMIRNGFARRLDLACQRKGLPAKGRQLHIAKLLKLTPKAINKWFNAETMPSVSNTYALAKILDTTPEWLTFGDSDVVPVKSEKAKTYRYPLISAIQAGTWTDIYDYRDSEGYNWLESEIEAAEESFFLEIKGQSMEPKFSEGDLVLIDPSLTPHPGQFVAAVNGDGEATFKQYKQLDGISPSGNQHFELVPLNPMFPTLSSMTRDIRIIGVAVEHRSYL